jgi:uncharacterized protein YciI
MPLFVVVGLDHPPHAMPQRDAVRTEHRAYVKANDAPIRLAAAMVHGEDQCGSLYIFEAESEGEVRRWLATEPFVATNVYRDLVVREIRLAHQLLPPKDWNG